MFSMLMFRATLLFAACSFAVSQAKADPLDPATCPIEVRTIGVAEGIGAQWGMTAVEHPDRRPFVALLADNAAGHQLWTYSCTDGACGAGTLRSQGSFANPPSGDPITMIGDGGRPLIFALGDFKLDLFRCADRHCTSSTRRTMPNHTGYDFEFDGFLGSDGRPRLIGGIQNSPNIVMFTCNDQTCASSTRREIATGLSGGQNTAMRISRGPAGQVVVAHEFQETAGTNHPRVMICDDENCSSPRFVTPVVAPNTPVNALQMRADGRLIMVENGFDTVFFSRLRNCSNSECTVSTTQPLSQNFNYSLVRDAGDRPITAYSGFTWGIQVCDSPACGSQLTRPLGTAGSGGAVARISLTLDGRPLVATIDYSGGPPRLALCPPIEIHADGFESIE